MSQLETGTTNFLDLIGHGRRCRVPSYQRDYAWSAEQWEDLWNDVADLHTSEQARHYMGALVIERLSEREFRIIDGQQRLATLSLLALAVLAQLTALAEQDIDPEANRERVVALRNRFIGEKDPASLQESSKLFLNQTDDPFYQDCLVQGRDPMNPPGLPKSNKLLWDCFCYFRERLAAVETFTHDGAALARFLNETIARQLLFIVISIDDALNAYTVFETLNARGLELSSTDLLKNYLFSRIQLPSDRETLQRRWRHLTATVRQERFPEFLRYHLLCQYRQVHRQRLFKMVRDSVREPRQIFNLMQSWEQRAELFSALFDPYHEFWIERADCQPLIKELVLFDVYQMTPLLFAAWEQFGAADFTRTLKMSTAIAFRYSIVSQMNTNALELIVHDAAKGILEGRLQSPAAVFSCLQSLYVSDEYFQQNFAQLEIDTSQQRKKLAKYILARLEADGTGKPCDAETDPATIEHILPENPSEDWAALFPPERWASAIYRLGNLTLLEPDINRRIANLNYDEKKPTYTTSGYGLTRAIARIAPEWTPAFLQKRQMFMAQRAVHLWRVDFD
ncbi:MAG: DUF262 domain-containing protein, partial [Halochromatium sp.]